MHWEMRTQTRLGWKKTTKLDVDDCGSKKESEKSLRVNEVSEE